MVAFQGPDSAPGPGWRRDEPGEAEVSGDHRGAAAAGGDRGVDPGPDDLRPAAADRGAVRGPAAPCPTAARAAGRRSPGRRPGSRRWSWRPASSRSASPRASGWRSCCRTGPSTCWPTSARCTPAGVPVTFYATLAAEQVGFVAGDCDARIAVLDGADQLARWAPVLDELPGLAKVIVLDAAACPAGDQYLTWDDFAALGRERLAASPDEVTARVAAITPGRPGDPAVHLGHHGQPQGRPASPTAACCYEVGDGTARREHRHRRALGLLPAAGAHRRADVQHLHPAVGTRGHVHFCPDAKQLVGGGRRGPADRVLRRAAGLGEDPGRHPGAARRRAGRGQAGRRGAGHGHRPALRGELPVRPDHPARAGRGVPRRPTRRCWARSARCSGWARPRSCPARRRRCRPTWPRSSPGSA